MVDGENETALKDAVEGTPQLNAPNPVMVGLITDKFVEAVATQLFVPVTATV
jgi:hypothetical protein